MQHKCEPLTCLKTEILLVDVFKNVKLCNRLTYINDTDIIVKTKHCFLHTTFILPHLSVSDNTEDTIDCMIRIAYFQIERFRNRVIQVTFSVPGTRTPDKQLNDDEVVDALQKIISEKVELVKQIRELKQTINEFGSSKKDSVDGAKRLKQHLGESVVSVTFCIAFSIKSTCLLVIQIRTTISV